MSYVRNLRRLPNPSVVPSVPVRLIDGHPLGIEGGLNCLIIPGAPNGGLTDITGMNGSLSVATPANYSVAGSAIGPCANHTKSGSFLYKILPTTSPLANGNSFSCFWAGNILGQPSTNSHITGILYTTTNTSPYVSWDLYAQPDTGIEVYVGTAVAISGEFYETPASTPNFGINKLGVSFGVSGTSVTVKQYQNGEAVISDSYIGTITFSPTPVLILGGYYPVPSRILNMLSGIGAYYNQTLSMGQHAQLAAEPFCMLERSGRMRSWSFPSTSLFNVTSSFNLLSEVLSSLTSLDIIYVDSTAINPNPKDLGIGRRKQKFGSGRSLDPFGVGQKQSIFGIGDP